MTAATRGLPMLRAWHGDHVKRGAIVVYHGERLATVLSAQGADIAVRVFSTGERVIVKPHELGPVR